MSSFFEKLKKGMGIEAPEEGVKVEEKARKKRVPGSRKLETTIKPIETQVRKLELETPEIKKGKIEEEKVEITFTKEKIPEKPSQMPPEVVVKEKLVETKPSFAEATEGKEKWFEPEGELAIDVYQTETNLVIQTAIAGVKPENLDISMERDIIIVKGTREKPFVEEGDYFTQECFWGPFSREVILPVEVNPDRAEATMKDGILTIRIPKILREKKRIIKVRI